MQNLIFLLMRRMRAPLIVLICIYAISTLGFTLIPGVDPQGRPWHMGFFHAFYFVSFLGSTIGLGEIPYAFTDAQRMWTTFTIYTTVIAWLYAIGTLLAIIQDPGFRRVITWSSFARTTRHMAEPFYLVCGYGDTGSLLMRELADRGIHSVVVDIDPARIDGLLTEDMGIYIPGLTADASDPEALIAAGLRNRHCVGVIALTNDDSANLKIAITAKLLAPHTKVVCRAETHDTEANMHSFGTEHVVNPFDSFADRLGMAIHSPSMYLVYEWLTSPRYTYLSKPLAPPKGMWIVCGYGRFGKAVEKYLTFEGVRITIVEANPEKTRTPANAVIGRGTEAVTLREARIEQATGIIAGTDNDANNLSIIMTARSLKPELFTLVRQNQRRNDSIFHAAKPGFVMQPSSIIARKVLAIITTPLLSDFLHMARHHDEGWARDLVLRIRAIAHNHSPDTWNLELSDHHCPAIDAALEDGHEVRIAHICTDPHDRTKRLPCVPLLLKRGDDKALLPEENIPLRSGDQLLFCGMAGTASEMKWIANNVNVLDYVMTGNERPSGAIWRWFAGTDGA
jgi:voltage-gated potassium channel